MPKLEKPVAVKPADEDVKHYSHGYGGKVGPHCPSGRRGRKHYLHGLEGVVTLRGLGAITDAIAGEGMWLCLDH